MSQQSKGRFVWHELMTSDVDGAEAFYSAVVGWSTQPFEDASPPYTFWMAHDSMAGGLMEIPPEAEGSPPAWFAYVGVPDVDETVKQATRLGASVHVPPTDIPTVGRFAMLADPQGATFVAFTPADASADPEHEPRPMEFAWHELATTDHEAGLRFYAELFGWSKIDEMDMGPAGKYVMFGLGERLYGGMFNKPPEMHAPPHWLLYVEVEGLDAAMERVRDNGGQVLDGPMEVPGGRIAPCMDPQGAAFALHEKAG